MQVIISHVNTDFDAFASLLAAKKLYPEATVVLSDQQNDQVRRFLNIYRDTITYVRDRDLDWENVRELIMVDEASIRRLGQFTNGLKLEDVHITLYDHHPPQKDDVEADRSIIEKVGATVTLLVEEMKRQSIPISEFEATIFGLGIYTDTGNFTYNTTTERDLRAAAYLMGCGMNLEMIQQFSEESLNAEQQALLDDLFSAAETIEIDGLEIVFAAQEQDHFVGGLALVTQKLLEMKGADAMISVVKMKRHVYIVGRGTADRVNLQPLLKKFGGGGHQHAGSATVRRGDFAKTKAAVQEHLTLMLQPAITARELMASPVKTLTPDTTIERAGELMYRYGHSGYPIVEDDKLVGIITRRDLDKGNHHGLGHAPVKAYMTTNIIDIHPEATLEEIQKIVIEHNVGRLPIVEDGKVVGIVTRTNIIEKIHEQTLAFEEDGSVKELKDHIQDEMKAQLPEYIYTVLEKISKTATERDVNVYLIGGIVRDILLKKENDDVDLVVEGDGIALAKQLQANYGGKLTTHESFGTATWVHPSDVEIDLATSRLEYYERPASLPDVEDSTLQEDLYRRDFTINAMAIHLNEAEFGHLVDPFSGQLDLYNETIKVLHNLSFVEDPTRILRAVRFETRFNFTMDEQTKNLALHSMEQMSDVSAKRIIDEVKRALQEEDPLRVIKRLYELNFWQQYTNETDASDEAMKRAEKLNTLFEARGLSITEKDTWFAYFSLPFFLAEAPEQVEPFILTREERKLYEQLSQLHRTPLEQLSSNEDLHRTLQSMTEEAILFTLASRALSNEAVILSYMEGRRQLKPYITGADLKAAGLQPGPVYKDVLFDLDLAILNGDVQSKAAAQRWLTNYIAEKEM